MESQPRKPADFKRYAIIKVSRPKADPFNNRNMTFNPYEAPQGAPCSKSVLRRLRLPSGVGYIVISVCGVVIYMTTALLLTPSYLPVPAWPAIAMPFVLSIFAAGKVQRLLVAPFVCILGISSSSLVFAMFRDWHRAGFQIIVPISIILSIPSILITVSRRRKRVKALPESLGTDVATMIE